MRRCSDMKKEKGFGETEERAHEEFTISGGKKQNRSNRRVGVDSYWKQYQNIFPKYFWGDDTRLASIVVSGASGSTVRDVNGRIFIDLTSQWATNNLGNVNPEILDTAIDALKRYGFLIYFMNPHVPMIELGKKLLSISPSGNLKRVFLELSGTGAAEAAVKFAVETSKRPQILSFMGQYHGLSIGAGVIGSLSASERRYWEAYQGGVVHVPYPFPYRRHPGMSEDEFGEHILGHIENQVLRYVAAPDRIAGVIFEPVACEAGVWIPPANFVRGLRKLCDEHGWLFIADEVETGLGRTGKMWAIEHFNVSPDLLVIGKALSGGLLPISAVLGTEKTLGRETVAAGTTFGGMPAACAAGIKTIELLTRDRLVEKSERLGKEALKRLKELEALDSIGEVRGLGLCLGIEIVKDKGTGIPDPGLTRKVFFECVRNGTIPLYNYGDHVLRIEPPLTIEKDTLDRALSTMEDALRRFSR